MICHLIAIANNKKTDEKRTLEYVFFTPNKSVIEKYKRVKKLYGDLKSEMKAIFAPETAISVFAVKHNIVINAPRFVEIGEVQDFNYEQLYLKG